MGYIARRRGKQKKLTARPAFAIQSGAAVAASWDTFGSLLALKIPFFFEK